ncbi:hypothetical protein Taro_009713 [Colocasia esculenta]|uniref:Uncharacterized protein n=1 Tax=Colocasia esculenta TaxID=4460 RepID=A0A843U5L1_COLES|nr:hypothetical protein [Colocasia esculenta]
MGENKGSVKKVKGGSQLPNLDLPKGGGRTAPPQPHGFSSSPPFNSPPLPFFASAGELQPFLLAMAPPVRRTGEDIKKP